MKTKLKILFILVVVSAIAYIQREQKSESFQSELLLSNIEALAQQEFDNRTCFGSGSIVCPATGAKVYSVGLAR